MKIPAVRTWMLLPLVLSTIVGLWLGGIATEGVWAVPQKAALGVVFGTTVRDDGAPGRALQERLEAGLALWRAGTVPRLMVSGAIESRNHQDEARSMKAWLTLRGVPPEDIVTDSRGNTTWLTAQHVAALNVASAVVVTQWFHVARARWALERAGVPQVSGMGACHFRLSQLWYLGREGVALPVYILTGKPSPRDGVPLSQ